MFAVMLWPPLALLSRNLTNLIWKLRQGIETIYGERFATRQSIRQEVFEYIETFYNTIRQHSTLGYISPEAFEAAAVA